MPHITKRFLDGLKRPSGRTEDFYWDNELRGFGVRLKRSGVASYLIQYRTAAGRTRRLTLARVGTCTPDEARKRAKSELAGVAAGKDPSAQRKAARSAQTFGDLIETYQKSERWTRKSPTGRAVDQGRIDRHLLPLLAKRTVVEITRKDMEKVFQDIRGGKTAIDKPSGKKRGRIRVRGGEGTARRTLGLASALFAFAVKEEFIAANPCQGIEKGRDGERTAIVENTDAYARLFAALEDPKIAAPAADALRLIALTGARRGEIVGLTWGQVDLAHGRLVLQNRQHKAGHKTGKIKYIPLPTRAQEIIAALKPRKRDDLVIRSAKDGARIDLKKVWARVRTAAKLPADLTIHGLRHTIASHLAMDGATGPQIQSAMGHANIKTSTRYIHFADARRSELAERAASVANAGLAAARGEQSGKVLKVQFAGKKSRKDARG